MIGTLRKHQALLAAVLLALCAVGYPVAGLLAAVMDWPSRWTSVPFRAGVAMLSVTLLALLPWRGRPLSQWAWVLAGWLALYALRLAHNVLEAYPGAAHEMLFFGLAVVLPVIALIRCDLDAVETRLRAPVVWLAAGIVAAAIVGDYLGWFGANSFTFTGRLSTSTVNPITLGHTAVSLLLALVAWQIQGESRYRWVLWALVGLGLIGLSYAGSRGPYVALLFALGLLILAVPAVGGRLLAGRAAALLVVIAAAVLFLHPLPVNHLIAQSDQQRLERLVFQGGQKHQERQEIQTSQGSEQQSMESEAEVTAESGRDFRSATQKRLRRLEEERQEIQTTEKSGQQSMGGEAKASAESVRDFSSATQMRLEHLEVDRQNRLDLSDGATQTRLALLKSSVKAFIQNPILGISNWMVNGGQYPHNLILESFQNLGIVGGAVFVALLVVGSFRAWRRIRSGQYLVAMLFFQALMAGQFSGSLYAHAQLWGTLALLLGANAGLVAKNLDVS